MTKEQQLYDALMQIAHRDCAAFCGLVARKAMEKMRADEEKLVEE